MRNKICILFAIACAFLSTAAGQEPDPIPKLISAPKPDYPKAAKEAGIGGRITVKVVVDAQGAIASVGDAEGPAVICNGRSNDPRLEAMRNAVVESMKQAKFEAAMKHGVPVKAVAYVGLTFDPTGSSDPAEPRRIINVGAAVVKNALKMPKPPLPSGGEGGPVPVRVLVDETGSVFTAEALSGHPLSRRASERSACEAKFTPFQSDGKAIRAMGVITYNFFRRQ